MTLHILFGFGNVGIIGREVDSKVTGVQQVIYSRELRELIRGKAADESRAQRRARDTPALRSPHEEDRLREVGGSVKTMFPRENN